MHARTRKFKLATTVYYDFWYGHKMEYQTIRTKRRRAAYLANLSPINYAILKSKKLWQTSHNATA